MLNWATHLSSVSIHHALFEVDNFPNHVSKQTVLPSRLSSRSSVCALKRSTLLSAVWSHVSFLQDSLQWNLWKELEESRERQFKTLQRGFMARKTAQENSCLWGSKKRSHSLYIALWSKMKYIWNKSGPAGDLPVCLFTVRLNFNH